MDCTRFWGENGQQKKKLEQHLHISSRAIESLMEKAVFIISFRMAYKNHTFTIRLSAM